MSEIFIGVACVCKGECEGVYISVICVYVLKKNSCNYNYFFLQKYDLEKGDTHKPFELIHDP